jgi:uncharacterized membrane protein
LQRKASRELKNGQRRKGETLKKLFFALFLLILIVQTVYAQESSVILRDINTNKEITNAVAEVDIASMSLTQYVDEENLLSIDVEDGKYSIVVKVDRPFTGGKDYFRKQSITIGEASTSSIYLYPVGSLRGIVKDAFDNVVGEAELRFECMNDIGSEYPAETSMFGSFEVNYMPVGSCKIFANFGEAVGFIEVEVGQGQIVTADIMLDKTIIFAAGSARRAVEIIALLFVIAVIVYAAVKYGKKPKKEKMVKEHTGKKVRSEKSEKKEHGTRAEDVLKTLHGREKAVVEYLMQQSEAVLQSNVRHNTGVPRTSLSRILKSLEAKNILKVKSVGKVVKLKLTDWFLERE